MKMLSKAVLLLAILFILLGCKKKNYTEITNPTKVDFQGRWGIEQKSIITFNKNSTFKYEESGSNSFGDTSLHACEGTYTYKNKIITLKILKSKGDTFVLKKFFRAIKIDIILYYPNSGMKRVYFGLILSNEEIRELKKYKKKKLMKAPTKASLWPFFLSQERGPYIFNIK
jgi:hypothetical protein